MEGSRQDHPYYGRPDYERPGHNSQQAPLFSADFKRSRGLTNALVTIAIQIGFPLAVVLISRSGGTPNAKVSIYLLGFLATIGAYVVSSNLLPVRGYSNLKKQFAARLLASGVDVERLNGLWVAFSPDGEPRVYANNFDWDLGFLLILPDRLCFLGELVQFALTEEQVAKIRLGPGGPSLWGTRRVYIDWHDQNGATCGLNFRPADASSMRQIGPLSRRLLDRLQRWRVTPCDESAISSRLAAIGLPNIVGVASQSVAEAASYSRLALLCFNSLFTAAIICFAARVSFDPSNGSPALYVLAVVFSVWLLQALPCIASGKRAA